MCDKLGENSPEIPGCCSRFVHFRYILRRLRHLGLSTLLQEWRRCRGISLAKKRLGHRSIENGKHAKEAIAQSNALGV